jgi:hypothetical protein
VSVSYATQTLTAGEREHRSLHVAVIEIALNWDALLRGFQLAAEQVQLGAEPFVPPDPVDGSVPGGEHEPGAGVGRDALGRPLFQRRDQGVLRQLLGQGRRPGPVRPGRR